MESGLWPAPCGRGEEGQQPPGELETSVHDGVTSLLYPDSLRALQASEDSRPRGNRPGPAHLSDLTERLCAMAGWAVSPQTRQVLPASGPFHLLALCLDCVAPPVCPTAAHLWK